MRRLDIDLLRVSAIILVVLAHTANLLMGVIGVQIFFLVSGYLLADFNSQFTGPSFVLYRFARLFPLSLLMSLIFFRIDSLHWFLPTFLWCKHSFLCLFHFPVAGQ